MPQKVIVISGGSGGLGKEIAKELAEDNKVIILSPSKEKLREASKEIGCDYYLCDVSSFNSCKSALNDIAQKNDRVDCIINGAGLWIEGELDENMDDDIKRVIDVNLTGSMNLTKSAIPQMKRQKGGTIIFINSQAGLYAKEKRSVYNATKWGLDGFAKSLQPELARYGVRVTSIYPGKLRTRMFEKVGIHKDMKDALNPQEVAKAIRFVLSLKEDTVVPELGIKYITN
jgi:NADP-dependent 3-hydroxy acid dehydrogenase YdfG